MTVQETSNLAGLTILGALGHTDYDGFGSGETLGMLAARGARITMVCGTNGDVGEISDPSLATPQTLGQIRQEEIRQAMAVMGIQDLRFLGYRDCGMQGTKNNDHPASLYQAEPGTVVAQVVDIIGVTRPDIVITHDPTGGYGHPDHTTMHRHVTEAFSLAADPSYQGTSVEGAQAWKPRLLYYICFPRSTFRRIWQQMLDASITPPFASLEIESLGTPDELVTTVVDLSAYVEVTIASLNCPSTQMDPNGPFAQLPQQMMREFMSTEHFTLAMPEGAGEVAGLLAGL
jgi:LmbE family N-acetylglucosaminyl deacetylase